MFKYHHLIKKSSFNQNPDLNNNPKKTNVIGIFSICIFTFSLGICMFIPGGIANPLIATFNNVNESNVNLSLTLYMIGIISASLFVPLLFFKLNRKYILVWSAIIFFIGNILTGVSVNFSMLLVFRFITGLCHGAMFSVGAVVASSLVAKDKQGSAVTICFTALFIAGFTLVPLFTYTSSLGLPKVGTTLFPQSFLVTYRSLPMDRQYWRWVFFVTGIIVAISALLMQFFISKNIPLKGGQKNPWRQLSILLYYPFDLSMIFGCLVFLAIFLIYPLLQKEWVANEVGIIANNQELVGVLVGCYCLGMMVGNQWGGRFSNGKTFPTVYYMLLLMIIVVICLTICVVFKNPIGIFIFTILVPTFGYAVLPNTFALGMSLGRYHDKTEAVDLESGISEFMIAGGGMIGSAIGGPICSYHTGDLIGKYNANNFFIVCIIAIVVCSVAILFILPVHWYMHNNQLIKNKVKFYDRIINQLPFLYDEYASIEVKQTIENLKQSNPHRKVIKIKPIFHRKIANNESE